MARLVSFDPTRWFLPLAAVLAAAIGLAAAHADGIALPPLKAAAALLLAAPAVLGFRRTIARVLGEDGAVPQALVQVVLPAVFLVLLTSGTDHFVRGAWSLTAFAAGLPFAVLAACQPLIANLVRRADDSVAGRDTLATAIAPINAKLWVFGLALPAYLWLVVQVGRDALPQGCAAAAITILLSLRAVRTLQEDADDAAECTRAVRLTALAALAHGAILVAALLFDSRWPLP